MDINLEIENQKLLEKRQALGVSPMNTVSKTVKKLSNSLPVWEPVSLEEATWVCEFCGQPVEPLAAELGDTTRYRRRSYCDCPQAQAAKQAGDDRRQKREWKEQAEQLLLQAGLESDQYSRLRFNEWDPARVLPHSQIAYDEFLRYTEQVPETGRNWLYAYGSYGTGKTHLSVAAVRKIAAENLWQPHIVSWVELCQLTKESWGGHGETESSLWGRARAAMILLIDDLDKTSTSEWAMTKLLALINYRYNRQKPTIITANHSLKQLMDQWQNHSQPHVRDTGTAVLSRIFGQLWGGIRTGGDDQRRVR